MRREFDLIKREVKQALKDVKTISDVRAARAANTGIHLKGLTEARELDIAGNHEEALRTYVAAHNLFNEASVQLYYRNQELMRKRT